MFAIEGLHERFRDRGFSRVGDEHASPGHRLQHCPMQSQRKDKHPHSDKMN